MFRSFLLPKDLPVTDPSKTIEIFANYFFELTHARRPFSSIRQMEIFREDIKFLLINQDNRWDFQHLRESKMLPEDSSTSFTNLMRQFKSSCSSNNAAVGGAQREVSEDTKSRLNTLFHPTVAAESAFSSFLVPASTSAATRSTDGRHPDAEVHETLKKCIAQAYETASTADATDINDLLLSVHFINNYLQKNNMPENIEPYHDYYLSNAEKFFQEDTSAMTYYAAFR